MSDLTSVLVLSALLPIVIAVPVLLIVGLLVMRLVRGSAQNREVLAHGASAPATIVRVWETGTRLNDQPQIGVVLQVQPADKPSFQAEAKMFISYLQAAQMQPGMLVNVRYDPQNPGKVAVESVTGMSAASLGATNVQQFEDTLRTQDKYYEAIRSMGEADVHGDVVADVGGERLGLTVDGPEGAGLADDSNLEVTLAVAGPAGRLPAPVEHALYRVAHEALVNAWRHARCRAIRLDLVFDRGEVVLSVCDDGEGLDGAKGAQPNGFGTNGLRHATAQVGGRLRVANARPRGVVVEARVPRGKR